MRHRRSFLLLLPALAMVVALTACGDDDDDEGSSGGGGGADAISIEGFAFQPDSLTVSAGTTVEVTNGDSAPHTWTADDGSWDSGNLDEGASASHTFDEAGEFSYHCEIHETMTGTVVVE